MMTVLLGWCKLSCKGDTGQDVVEALRHVGQAEKRQKTPLISQLNTSSKRVNIREEAYGI